MGEEERLRLLTALRERREERGGGGALGIVNQLQPIQGLAAAMSGDASREFDYPELPTALAGTQMSEEERLRRISSLQEGMEENSGGALDVANQLQPIQGLAEALVGSQVGENPAALQGMMGFARDDLGKLGVYQSQFPDSPAGIDEFGNVFVEHDGQNYYLDRPGASPQDVADIGMTGLSEAIGVLPGARAGQWLAGGLGRIIGTGGGAAVGSVAQDLMASAGGSEQGIDPEAALVAGVFGFGGEAGIMLGGQVAKWLRGTLQNRSMFSPESGLTDQGREAMERLGLDPEKLTDDVIGQLRADPSDRFGAQARELVAPSPGDAVTRAQNLPAAVPLSRADVNPGNPRIQRQEELFAGGAMGQPAADVMQQFRSGQTGALNANIEMLQGRLGGQVDRAAPGGGMDIMQQRLLSDVEASKRGIDQAYDAARSAGGEASLSQDGIYQMSDDFVRIIDENSYDIGQMPRVRRRLEDFHTIMESGELRPDPSMPANTEALSAQINEMEKWRRRLSNDIIDLRRSTETGAATERRALTQMIRQYDDFMRDALDNALVEGNEEAIDLWRDATTLRREHFQRYEEDDLIRRITETQPTVNEMGERVVEPVLSPQQSVNLLFGTNALATSRFSNSAGALRRLRSMYGVESREWDALREEAFVRLAPDRGNINDPAPAFTAFVRNYDKTMREAPEMMNILFNAEERETMRNLRDTMELITTRVPGVVNRSGSGHLMLQAFGRFFSDGRVGDAVKAGLNKGFGWLRDGMRASRAREMVTQPVLPPAPLITRGLAGALSAGTAGTVGPDPILQGIGLQESAGSGR